MAHYDINNKEQSVAYGGILVSLIACFAAGVVIGVYFGVAPFWKPTFGGLSHLGFSIAVSAPFLFLFSVPHLMIRFALDEKKKAQQAAEKEALKQKVEQEVNPNAHRPQPLVASAKPAGFDGLKFGVSTGHLHDFEHVGGIPPGKTLYAGKEDCSKNIIIFGGIGSGKTTRAINPILKQLFEQKCGALVFDIKGDFSREVDFIARETGRTYEKVGFNGLTLNLIRGITPELAASYLKSCFIVTGSAGGNNAFFVDMAVELCRQCLTLIMLTGGDYSLAGLYDIVFSASKREAAMASMIEELAAYDLRQSRLAESVIAYFENIHSKFDEKMTSSVNSTVAQVLSPFSHPDLIDAFSSGSTEGEADLKALLNGHIFFVNLPMTLFGKDGSRFAYMLIKLRFMSLMRERRTRPELNQTTPVAFVCDEYQAIVDSITDTDFWDKSRSSGCIGVVSMQGVSSLYHSVHNKEGAEAILQNFRQRLIFRTEDEATMQMAQRLLGQVDVMMVSTSSGSSNSKSVNGSPGSAGSVSQSDSSSNNQSVSIQRQQLFDANDFRKLQTDLALFIGNIGNHAVDEVIRMQPLFVTDTPAPAAPKAATTPEPALV